MTIYRSVVPRLIAAVIAFFVLPHAGQLAAKEYTYRLDLPEGFVFAGAGNEGNSFLYVHDRFPLSFVIRLYDGTDDAVGQLSVALGKLNATAETPDAFTWRNVTCAVSSFTMTHDRPYGGWALSVPLLHDNAVIVLLCYAPDAQRTDCEPFIISCLNSLTTDRASLTTPGPMTTYAFPAAGLQPVTLSIGGRTITTHLDAQDVEAAQFLIDTEYAVLRYYVEHPQWKEAWQRYYRAVFRDGAGRVKRCAFDIAAAVTTDDGPDENLMLMQTLLTWTQGFPYERGTPTSSDLTSAPACLLGDGNDCDARSLLLAAIAENLNIDATVFVSRTYSHAVFGVALDAPGAKITVDGVDYLLGETTASVPIGQIAADMNDTTQWIPVTVPQ
ncbi:MAG: hypothetical protein IJ191_05020 [Treponema sp.]|nr:hypothetical protein [Treponema sp.]